MKVAAEKAALRRRARRRRDALVNGELERRSEQIARRVMGLSGWQRARSRLLFRSFGSEVLTDQLIDQTLGSGVELVLPRVKGLEETLALHAVADPECDLAPGCFGIDEPICDRCPERSLYDVDFVLVPGLAFDRAGGRLGYGGGFFDYILNVRTDLVESGAVVAVAFSCQVVEEVPTAGWDVRVPMIATEDELIDARDGSG
ncbi:MAG: 5-formyltetrahydrofolate cyclo-ligase [Armatimonadia bacterium]|nr:5-formyltetrahydrofolate cyclo-ligase [Armatimonadia bacterium]